MSFVYIPEFSAIIKCIFTFAVSGVFRTILKLIFIDTAQPGSIALMHCTARPVACHSPMYKLHSGVAQPQAVTLTTPSSQPLISRKKHSSTDLACGRAMPSLVEVE